MFKDLENKIILSISYTNQFQYPLTQDEVFHRIIGSNKTITLVDVKNELDNLVCKGLIGSRNNYYFLMGNDKTVDIRLNRQDHSQKKWLEVDNFVNFAKKIPWIKAVVITGSLAVENVKESDDIDFFIVTEKNRLWLSRFFVVIAAFIKGKKRSWDIEEANSWCLNLWLDETSLKLPGRLRNIYGAFEVSQAVWTLNKGDTKQKFFELNDWASKFLPNYFEFQKNNSARAKVVSSDKINNSHLVDKILSTLNSGLFLLQYLYMKPRITKERVGKSYAFFHPRDTKGQIFRNWLREFKKNAI